MDCNMGSTVTVGHAIADLNWADGNIFDGDCPQGRKPCGRHWGVACVNPETKLETFSCFLMGTSGPGPRRYGDIG